MSLDVAKDAADIVLVHVGNWIYWILLLLKVPTDAALSFCKSGQLCLHNRLRGLRIADINHSCMTRIVLNHGAVAILNVQEVNRSQRLLQFLRGFKEEASVSVIRESHSILPHPNDPDSEQ